MAGMTRSNRRVGSTTRQRRMKRRWSALADCRSEPSIAVSNVEVYPAAPATVQKSSEMAIFSFIYKHLNWFECLI